MRGKVIDRLSRQPVIGAIVRPATLDTLRTVTDTAGVFLLKNVPPGIHAFRVTAAGYAPQETPDYMVSAATPEVNVEMDEDIRLIPDEDTLIRSHKSIGHGIVTGVKDIIYVKTENFSASNNQQTAYDIEKMNKKFIESGEGYVLVGPGRWGSSDPWLGIPVKWPYISAAKVIVEAGLTNYRIDPSQGTHFFQNLTSLGVGYFTVNDFIGDGVYRQEFLNELPAVEETQYVRHIHLEEPLTIMMDGMKKEGIIMMPVKNNIQNTEI